MKAKTARRFLNRNANKIARLRAHGSAAGASPSFVRRVGKCQRALKAAAGDPRFLDFSGLRRALSK